MVPVAEPSLPGSRREGLMGAPVPNAGRSRDEDPLSLPACRRGGLMGAPVPEAGRRRDEDPLSLSGCRRAVMRSCSPFRVQDEEETEELQIWDCSSCFRGKKGESGKCPFCTIGILWSH